MVQIPESDLCIPGEMSENFWHYLRHAYNAMMALVNKDENYDK